MSVDMFPNLLSLFLSSYWCAYGPESTRKLPSGEITMNLEGSTKKNAINAKALTLVVDVTSSCIDFMFVQMMLF